MFPTRNLRYVGRLLRTVLGALARRMAGRGLTSSLGHDLARATTRATLMSTLDLGIPWARRLGEWAARSVRTPEGVERAEGGAGGVTWIELTARPEDDPPVFVYFHGGGYVLGSPEAALAHLGPLTLKTGWRTLAIRYPLAPETPVEAIRAFAARAVTEVRERWPRAALILGGDSAGAALALEASSAVGSAVEGLVLLSPWVEPLAVGGSIDSNAGRDVADPSFLHFCWSRTGGGVGSVTSRLPFASGDAEGLQAFVSVGGDEMLHDQVVRLVAQLEALGVRVRFVTHAGSAHTYWALQGVDPNAERLIDDIVSWEEMRPPA